MAALYITSTGEAAGKSTLCAGLAGGFQAKGKKVGYLKPLSTATKGGDPDVEPLKQLLNLEEPAGTLCPVTLGAKDIKATLKGKTPPWLKDVRKAYDKVAKDKDVVLLEGVGGFKSGNDMAQVARITVEALKAKSLLLVRGDADLDVKKLVAAAEALGDSLVGVVLNAVPERRMELVRTNILPALEKSGISVLGGLPEERAMSAVTVGELAEHIGGSILNAEEHSGDLVENVMVGAMSVDSALTYLSLRHNKAVITRGDRPDIQLAALETSTSCLVLTGNIEPAPNILSRAKELEVPVLTVDKDTPAVMEAMEKLFERTISYNGKKMERMGKLLAENLDLEAIYSAA